MHFVCHQFMFPHSEEICALCWLITREKHPSGAATWAPGEQLGIGGLKTKGQMDMAGNQICNFLIPSQLPSQIHLTEIKIKILNQSNEHNKTTKTIAWIKYIEKTATSHGRLMTITINDYKTFVLGSALFYDFNESLGQQNRVYRDQITVWGTGTTNSAHLFKSCCTSVELYGKEQHPQWDIQYIHTVNLQLLLFLCGLLWYYHLYNNFLLLKSQQRIVSCTST